MKKCLISTLSLFTAIIMLFTGCQKYDIVDHKTENTLQNEEITSFDEDTSVFVSYDDLEEGLSASEEDTEEESSAFSKNPTKSNSSLNKNQSKISGSSNNSKYASTTSANISSKKSSSSKKPASSSKVSSTTPSIPNESSSGYYYSTIKGVWLTQFNLSSAMQQSGSASTFRTKIAAIYKKIKDFGFNTVVVQLRPNGDAFYPSAYFPWSRYCTGTVGKNPGFDITKIMLEEAHKKKLSFHAWFNPLRLETVENMKKTSSSFQTKKWYSAKNGRVVTYNGYCYLNPAYSEVRTFIVNGAKEIAIKYKVDALHIDDYFYPTTASSFDSAAFKAQDKYSNLGNFRRSNINKLVKGLYKNIKSVKGSLKFGISPAGNINNNYSSLYADVEKWGSNYGYMDYCMPQIYFGYKHNTLDYLKCLNQWKNIITSSSVDLCIGLAAYKIGYASDGGSSEWKTNTNILKNQVTDAKNKLGAKYGGFCVFDYDSLFSTASLNTKFRNNLKKVM